MVSLLSLLFRRSDFLFSTRGEITLYGLGQRDKLNVGLHVKKKHRHDYRLKYPHEDETKDNMSKRKEPASPNDPHVIFSHRTPNALLLECEKVGELASKLMRTQNASSVRVTVT